MSCMAVVRGIAVAEFHRTKQAATVAQLCGSGAAAAAAAAAVCLW
jgi:hypothetical protein